MVKYKMRIKTHQVLDSLSNSKSITEFLEENKEQFDLCTIGEYIKLELEKRDLVKEEVIKNSGIIKRYFNQLFNNSNFEYSII